MSDTRGTASPPPIDPGSATVLEQARRAVRERRDAAMIRDALHQRGWVRAGTGLAMLLILTVLAWPSGTLMDRLRWLVQGVCDQRNMVTSGTVQLPLDARCTGIYTALLATLLFLAALRRLRAAALPPRPITIVLIGAIGLMGVDGLNSLLQHSGHNLYSPHNALRLASGMGAGLSFALLGLALLNSGLRPPSSSNQTVITSWGELWGGIAILLLLGMLLWQGAAWLFYPLALFSVAGLIVTLFMVNLAATALASRLYRRVLLLLQLARPAVISIALTAGELLVLAWLRTALEQAVKA